LVDKVPTIWNRCRVSESGSVIKVYWGIVEIPIKRGMEVLRQLGDWSKKIWGERIKESEWRSDRRVREKSGECEKAIFQLAVSLMKAADLKKYLNQKEFRVRYQ
jgi:hypothetical protein